MTINLPSSRVFVSTMIPSLRETSGNFWSLLGMFFFARKYVVTPAPWTGSPCVKTYSMSSGEQFRCDMRSTACSDSINEMGNKIASFSIVTPARVYQLQTLRVRLICCCNAAIRSESAENHFLLGLIQRPPRTSEITTNANAAQVKAVLSVERPMVRKTIPRIRNAIDARLFGFMA